MKKSKSVLLAVAGISGGIFLFAKWLWRQLPRTVEQRTQQARQKRERELNRVRQLKPMVSQLRPEQYNINVPLELYHSRARNGCVIAMFVLLGIFFLAIGFYKFTEGGVCIAGCFAGALVMLVIEANWSTTKPEAIIDSKGITRVVWPWKTIPWEDIYAVWMRKHNSSKGGRTRGLAIELKEPEKYITQMKFLDRKMWRLTYRWGWGHAHINALYLDRSLDDIWDYICWLEKTGHISVRLKDTRWGLF